MTGALNPALAEASTLGRLRAAQGLLVMLRPACGFVRISCGGGRGALQMGLEGRAGECHALAESSQLGKERRGVGRWGDFRQK